MHEITPYKIANPLIFLLLHLLMDSHLAFLSDDSILCQHTGSPLGNGAIVETIDKKILLLQRSNNVGEFPGHFVFPGGHPEVFNIVIRILNPLPATN